MTDKDAIEKLRKDYEVSVNEGEIKLMMSTLTDDIVALAPGFPVVSGEDMENWISKTFFDPFDIEFSSEDVEVETEGNLGYVRGHYKQALIPKHGGDTIELIGKYLCIVKRQSDGSWRFSHIAWNSDST